MHLRVVGEGMQVEGSIGVLQSPQFFGLHSNPAFPECVMLMLAIMRRV
jgi:hypothetical protein